jgi:hypothetical protein
VLAGVVASLLALSAAPALAAETCPNEAARQETHSEHLSDCRAYELVSPPDKNGADVIAQTYKTHVASDGNRVTFSAYGAFGALKGTSLDTEYMSRRTGTAGTNGWATQGINPLGAGETFPSIAAANVFPTYMNGFTSDLSAAIYLSWHPLTDAPNVAEVMNLYRINGLGSDSANAALLTDSVAPLPEYNPLLKLRFLKPDFVGASRDLTHVAFESGLTLTNDAPPQPAFPCGALGVGCPTLLYENVNGAVRLVGRVPQGADTTCDDVAGPACVAAPSAQAGIPASSELWFIPQKMVSEDGRRIVFQVPAGSDSGAIYVREDGVRTVQLAQNGQVWDASADGSRIFFITGDSLLPDDTDTAPDLYMYDFNAPAGQHLTLVSASSVADRNVGSVVGTSTDGHYVYFVCAGQLVPGEPAVDAAGLYVWHDGQLAYIGQFEDTNEAALNGPRTPTNFVVTAMTSRVSPDGRHLLFMTKSDAGFRGRGGFAGYDQAENRELYLYSADTGRLVCASCNPTGRPATTDALTAVREGSTTTAYTTKLSHALSDDGRRVFFTTAEALVPEDTNGVADAYEYDASSGAVHLLSSGSDPAGSYLVDASANGDDAFFATRQRLVGWDVDDNYDLYDARVGGGFPEPVKAVPCVGEGCLGALSNPPSFDTPSSLSVTGLGNPKTSALKKVVVKPLTKAQKLKKALKGCKSRRKKSLRKKCESSARKSFGRGK